MVCLLVNVGLGKPRAMKSTKESNDLLVGKGRPVLGREQWNPMVSSLAKVCTGRPENWNPLHVDLAAVERGLYSIKDKR